MRDMQEEKSFLDSYDANVYERPSVAVDILIFRVDLEKGLSILLVKRSEHPFKDCLSLPGGFVALEDSLEETAKKKLKQKTGIEDIYMEQLYTFGDVQRDPRTRVISVAYLALVSPARIRPESISKDADWYRVCLDPDRKELVIDGEEALAFDHKKIITYAIERLRGKIGYTDIAMDFLKDPEHFAIYELQKIHEAILGKSLDTPNFRRMFQSMYVKTGKAAETGEKCTEYAGRSSKYYSYNQT